jgi:hypothetical protein
MSRALTIGLLALAGALLGSLVVRDTYASECAAQFAAGRWESAVEGGVYSHVLPLEGGVVVHNEEVTVGSYCHAAWKRAHAGGRRLQTGTVGLGRVTSSPSSQQSLAGPEPIDALAPPAPPTLFSNSEDSDTTDCTALKEEYQATGNITDNGCCGGNDPPVCQKLLNEMNAKSCGSPCSVLPP